MGLLPIALYGLVWWPLTFKDGGLVDRLLAMQQASSVWRQQGIAVCEAETEMVVGRKVFSTGASTAGDINNVAQGGAESFSVNDDDAKGAPDAAVVDVVANPMRPSQEYTM